MCREADDIEKPKKVQTSRAANRPGGLRCRVCTGCGLCPGVTAFRGGKEIHVLAEDAMAGERIPLPQGRTRLAVADIGTTTVAMLLYGQDGSVVDRYVAVNPQCEYGADVISRIQAAERESAAEDMRQRILHVLEQGLTRFQRQLDENQKLLLVLAANTTMNYLLMGWNPSELGRAPFCATHLSSVRAKIGEAPCFLFPGFSAFVGGDIAAGVYACGMAEREEITLLIDLGTNGEMVLGNGRRRIACATAAGPAFEGGVNRGIWGADMISLLAALRREGLLDETGLLAEEYFEAGVRIGNVRVTEEAVRSVQLAKAAIAAGVDILLERYGISDSQVDRVVLAGGFGYYLKPEDAAEIGLLTDSLAKKAVAGGNTVLSGALKAGRKLLKEQAEGQIVNQQYGEKLEEELQTFIAGTEVLNLAEEPDFEKRYLLRMNLSVSH